MNRLSGPLCVLLVLCAGAAWAADQPTVTQAIADLRADCPQAVVLENDVRVTRVGGQPLAYGTDPEESAVQFLLRHSDVWGVAPGDLQLSPLAQDAPVLQPVMYEPETGQFRFYLLRFLQTHSGLPVFRAEARLLVRNEADYPLVLVSSALRGLGSFRPDWSVLTAPFDPTSLFEQDFDSFTTPELVVWAGLESDVVAPRLAYAFVAQRGDVLDPDYAKWLYVVDVAAQKVLYDENQIILTDVSGNVSGLATTGPKAEQCAAEVSALMKWAKVAIGSTTAYADASGNFVIPNGGSSPVTVSSYMAGRYFTVDNVAGSEETLTMSVTPPGPANFVHNSANTDENIRAQVNGYVQANVVRDFCLTYNPTYPTIATQLNFPVYVNRSDGYCPGNAWYDGSSINFCSRSGTSYANTAYSNIIHHEYGHHMVATGGSGQGQYGEGMSDCIGVLIADDPVCGYGFYYGQCSSGIRTASNSYQYPCSGEIHDCGQLLSGCIWSTRNALAATYPTTYLQILSNLTVNSILLHTGTEIAPDITIDFLTLDDNDGNINNGTPHRTEICTGFDAHNMDCPALQTGMSVSPASGFDTGGPVGGPFSPASTNYTVQNLGSSGFNYTVTKTQAWLTLSNTGGYLGGGQSATVTVSINANANSLTAGTYTDTVTYTNTTNHQGDTTRAVILTVGGPSLQYEWTLDTNPGWTISGGQWAWGTPTGGGGEYGNPDPTAGHTGTKVYGYNLSGDYANSIPEYHLTTTAINCTGLTQCKIKFWRWLGVEQSVYDHAYVRVSNNGSTWTTVWSNPASELADSAWTQVEYNIAAVADNQATVYVRWTMGTTDGGWRYCGWNVDDVQLWAVGSTGPQYTLTVNTTGQGTVTRNPPGPSYPPDTTVTLTANAAAGWYFDHWEGALSGSTNPTTLVMDSDKTVTAVFLQYYYTLTVIVTGQGSVALNPTGPTYPSNTTVTLTANAVAGWRFDHWEGALSGSANPATLVMDSNKTVTAVFVQLGNPVILMTFATPITIPGVGTVEDEDIVAYNTGTATWSLYFDGTDVGLETFAIDGLARLPSGELLMSFDLSGNLTGLQGGPAGTAVINADIVKFTPISLGGTTAGTWSFYFDGSDVGLTTVSENVDAIARLADGRLLISTAGDPAVTGLAGLMDEDAMQFTPTSLGSVTAGAWGYYFDGSDVGLSTNANEDIDALAVNSAGQLLLSTLGPFGVTGLSGADEDCFRFTPTSLGQNTAGTYQMYLDLSALGIDTAADINALEIIE